MTKILTIETTCDETAAAAVTENLEVLGSAVASQEKLHASFGGVVPEIASRAHLENILPVIDETLRRAKISLNDLDAVAVANTPGLAGSLLVGLVAAKTLCMALQKPLIAVNHLQAHIYACKVAFCSGLYSGSETPCNLAPGVGPTQAAGLKGGVSEEANAYEIFPCIGLIVSGGHSSLYRCTGPIDFEPLGGTIDDAAGEAFDKVAAMLGLPYPGGPSIQQIATQGNPKAYHFPRPFLDNPDRLAFSFSGLKTAVRYHLAGPGKEISPQDAAANLTQQEIADIAASFQEAVDCLVGKAVQTMRKTGYTTLCVGGGVAANARFRTKMAEMAQGAAAQNAFRLFIAPPNLCTDNAVMGAIAVERFRAGLFEPLDLDVFPGLLRNEV